MIHITNEKTELLQNVTPPDGVFILGPKGGWPGMMGVYIKDESCRDSLPEFWNRFYKANPSEMPCAANPPGMPYF